MKKLSEIRKRLNQERLFRRELNERRKTILFEEIDLIRKDRQHRRAAEQQLQFLDFVVG